MDAPIYAYGALYAVALPQLLLRRIQDHIWLRVLRHNGIPEKEIDKDIRFLPVILGCLERTLYLASVLAGLPEFIGLWLAIKVAGGWKGWSEGRVFEWGNERGPKTTGTVPGAQVFNAHLIGAGLSVLFAVTGAYSICWLRDGELVFTITIGVFVIVASSTILVWAKRKPTAPTGA